MRTAVLFAVLASLSTTAVAAPVISTYTSPMAAYTDDPRLILEPGQPTTVLNIYPTEDIPDTNSAWLDVPLSVWSGGPINTIVGLEICMESNDGDTYISQVRLSSTTTTASARVMFDDGYNWVSLNPECRYYDTGEVPIDGLMSLSLRINHERFRTMKLGMIRVEATSR